MAKLFDGKNIDLSVIGTLFTLNSDGEVFIEDKYFMTLQPSCVQKTKRLTCKDEMEFGVDTAISYDPFSDCGGYVIE